MQMLSRFQRLVLAMSWTYPASHLGPISYLKFGSSVEADFAPYVNRAPVVDSVPDSVDARLTSIPDPPVLLTTELQRQQYLSFSLP
jgi:hypothetical protein